MARPTSIPEKYEPQVLEKAAEGMTTRQIAEWLGKAHKIQCSYGAVARLLRRIQAQRGEVTRAVVAEKVGRLVVADLDVIGEELTEARKIVKALRHGLVDKDGAPTDAMFDTIGNTPRVNVLEKMVARVESLAAKRLALSGATPDAAQTPGVVVLPAPAPPDDTE